MKPSTISAAISFQAHFTHFPYGILAIPNTAISTPEVGVIIFVNPSPNWKASTVACLDSPIRSENGAITGIVIAAFAVAEGMNRFMKVWTPYIRAREAVFPAP